MFGNCRIWGCAALLATLVGCALCGVGNKPPAPAEERTGHPDEISCIAHPADTGHYIGYMVGGGSACSGDGPAVEDGTWGWDYGGYCLPSRVILDWFHCDWRTQGGNGSYKADGPRPLEEFERRND